MPGLIKGFQELYPNVQFLFHQGDHRLIPEWIRSGTIDFGFVSPKAAGGLETVHVKNGEMLAVLPQGHPLTNGSSVPLDALSQEPFILLEEGNYSEPLEAFEKRGLEPNVRYRLHDDYAIMTMVEAGIGVSILAKLMVERTGYAIACLPLDPPLKRSLSICYKDRDSLPIASKRFIDYLLENVDSLG